MPTAYIFSVPAAKDSGRNANMYRPGKVGLPVNTRASPNHARKRADHDGGHRQGGRHCGERRHNGLADQHGLRR